MVPNKPPDPNKLYELENQTNAPQAILFEFQNRRVSSSMIKFRGPSNWWLAILIVLASAIFISNFHKCSRRRDRMS